MYPDPMAFNPDRFLDADGKLNPDIMDPAQASFGFGRRLCVRSNKDTILKKDGLNHFI
jgi:cytochrome P450